MSNYSDSEFTDDPNTPWFKVLELIKPKSKVLDIGCSSGNFGAVIIREKQCIVDGLELDEKDVQTARLKLRKVLNLNVESDDLSELDEGYDVIYFGDVLEHLVDPVASLKKVKKLLNPAGAIIFSIPNMAHISVRIMLLEGRFEYGNTGLLDKTHLHFYDRNEVERIFYEAGYDIELFDWVSRDVPPELLAEQLKNIGLKANDKFFRIAKNVDAAAYQFIGRAAPSNHPKKPAKRQQTSPPIDLFERHLDELRKSYEQDIARVAREAKLSEADSIAGYEKRIWALEDRTAAYEKSLSWRVTKPLRLARKIIRRIQ